MLEPVDEKDPYKFYIKAWLYRSKEDNVNLYSAQNNQFFTSESISELLDELLEVEGELQASAMIEFFLPRALFCQKVDQWETARTAETIGVRNPVVIRSSERLKVTYRRNEHFWRDRWRIIQGLEAGLAPIHLICKPAHYDGKQVYSKLLQDKTKVCLCLLLVPPSVDLDDKNEVFL